MALSNKQRRFVEEYLLDLNATAAARRSGYSPHTAHAIGAENLTKPEVAAAIEAAMEDRAARCRVNADDVLRELMAIVRTNPSKFSTDNTGRLSLVDPDDTESWRAVASVKQKNKWIPQENADPIHEVEVEFKLWDKNSAIDKAMRHLGILSTDVKLSGGDAPFLFTLKIDKASDDSDG